MIVRICRKLEQLPPSKVRSVEFMVDTMITAHTMRIRLAESSSLPTALIGLLTPCLLDHVI